MWNRTPEKTASFAASSRVAGSVEEACRLSTVVVVSLRDYEASDALLRRAEVEEALSGKVLIQLTSGTSADARDSEAWATRSGVQYLDGAILTYPRAIGSADATILYSGSESVYAKAKDLLKALAGHPVFCGEEVGRAAALDMGFLAVVFGSVAAVLQGAALSASESVPLKDFLGLIRGGLVPEWFADLATDGVETGVYPVGNSTMVTNAAACQLVVRASQEAGVDASLPQSLREIMARTISLGHGGDDWSAMYEALRRFNSPAGG